ncbi:MAG: HNH endonuclease [Actinomycetales bacterium]|nr:HNH endonuclease [Actinomycetales bacterium]
MFDKAEGSGLGASSLGAAEILAYLGTLTPGARSLAELLELAPADLTAADALSFLEQLDRHLAWLHAVQADALVAIAGAQPTRTDVTIVRETSPARTAPDSGDLGTAEDNANHRPTGSAPESARVLVEICLEDIVREEISAALRWSGGYAQARIDAARLMSSHLRHTYQALVAGRISQAHAAVITDGARRLPGFASDDPAEQAQFAYGCSVLEGRALVTAEASTVARTRRAVNLAVATVLDAKEVERGRRGRTIADVSLFDDGDGSATLLARMPVEHAYACFAAVTALAQDRRLDVPCDARAGQRRAHALATLILGTGQQSTAAASPSGESDPGRGNIGGLGPHPRVHIDVVISLEALLGLTAQPAQLPGGESIPADVVRCLLEDATMRRLVTDPLSGQLLDLGRRTYRVPQALREFIEARDRTCRFPGCNRRATNCEIDHAVAWDDGGATEVANLGALCTRHHLVKTHGGWRIERSMPSGACTWQSPMGRRYEHEPRPTLEAPFSPPPTLRTAPAGTRPDHPRPDHPRPDHPRPDHPRPDHPPPDDAPPF